MTFLSLFILGFVASERLSVSLMPDIDVPEITVQVSYPNLSAAQMESNIVRIIRRQLLQVQRVKEVTSESRAGNAIIRLKLAYGTDMHFAFVEVNEKIDIIMGQLPNDIDRPRVIKASAIDLPVFRINVLLNKDQVTGVKNSETDFLELSDFSEGVLKRRFEQLSEVALVDISGMAKPEIIIIPDTVKMYNLGLKREDISNTLDDNNQTLGSILVKEGQYQYHIRVTSSLNNKWDIEELYINSNDRLFQIKDIAQVKVIPEKERGMFISNDQRGVTMSVIKQSEARMETLKEGVYSLIDQLEEDYPDIRFELVRDQSLLLDLAISNLEQSLLVGGSMAFLILFFFLKDFRSPVLIGLSVPASVIISILFFYMVGLSINIISLSGLILGVGMMIDNSIIVIDNISQYLDRGEKLAKACIMGTNEVIRPLISSVLTTCAVFVPLIFLSGIAGALFYDQAIAVSIGLITSLGVSITLLPVYFKLIYKSGKLEKASNFLKKINPMNYVGLYERGFNLFFKHKAISWIAFIAIAASSFWLYPKLDIQRLPAIKQSEFLIKIDWNESIHVDENRFRVQGMLEQLKGDIVHYDGLIGEQQFLLQRGHIQGFEESSIYVSAVNFEHVVELQTLIEEWIQNAFPRATVKFSRTDNIFEQIFADDAPPLLVKLIPMEMENNERLRDIYSFRSELQQLFQADIPELRTTRELVVRIDYEKLLLYDVDINLLIMSLRSGLNENEVGQIKSFKRFVPIKIGDENRALSDVIQTGLILNSEGKEIPISTLVSTFQTEDFKTVVGGKDGEYYPFAIEVDPNEIETYEAGIDGLRSSYDNYRIELAGSIYESRELIGELTIVVLVSLLLLYFILAAQFESLLQPIIVLTEIPINIAGALFLLYVFGSSINVMSLIGIVVMSGIIINDSILKIDTINRLRKEGLPVAKAVRVAGERRLKPILMTSLTTILALVPFLFSDQLGAALQKPLALTVIGGMTLGTIVSLYYIPLLYMLLSREK